MGVHGVAFQNSLVKISITFLSSRAFRASRNSSFSNAMSGWMPYSWQSIEN